MPELGFRASEGCSTGRTHCSLEELGWKAQRTPVDSVAEYAAWLEVMPGLSEVLAQADAKMRALGVVRKVES